MRPGPVRLVHRVLAGEPEPHVVLGQEHVADPGPDLRLVVADPDELGRGEPGERVVAGDRDEPLLADRRADPVALARRCAGRSRGSRAEGPRRPHRAGRARASARSGRWRPRRGAASRCAPGPHGSPRSSPSHQSRGSCSLQPGCGISKPYSADADARARARPRRRGRPSSRSSRRRCRGRRPWRARRRPIEPRLPPAIDRPPR